MSGPALKRWAIRTVILHIPALARGVSSQATRASLKRREIHARGYVPHSPALQHWET